MGQEVGEEEDYAAAERGGKKGETKTKVLKKISCCIGICICIEYPTDWTCGNTQYRRRPAPPPSLEEVPFNAFPSSLPNFHEYVKNFRFAILYCIMYVCTRAPGTHGILSHMVT